MKKQKKEGGMGYYMREKSVEGAMVDRKFHVATGAVRAAARAFGNFRL